MTDFADRNSFMARVDALLLQFESPVVIAGLMILLVYGVWWARFDGSLADFGSFVASGRAAGHGLNPYDAYPLTFRVQWGGQTLVNYNLNPPIVVLLFQAIGLLDPWLAFQGWFVFQAACYGVAVWLLLRAYPRARPIGWLLWLLALGGAWDTLALGQIYLPMTLAAVAAWLALERRQLAAAGLLIGLLAAIKPNLLVWPVVLVFAGHRRVGLVALATMASLSALPALAYGPEIYRQWLALILTDAHRIAFPTNASLAGLTIRYGLPWLGTVLSGAVLLGVAAWAWRVRPAATDASAVGLLAALLASPIAWVHYTLFLLPMFLSRQLSLPLRVAALMLALPVKVALLGAHGHWLLATVGSVFNYALLLASAGIVAQIMAGSRATALAPALSGPRLSGTG